ncbi:HAMP domain-containing protein [Candidatus Parcubacteria bacterium]|nr:HAMP domain-containing protein [Candidatus Parcubacteria bacterium]
MVKEWISRNRLRIKLLVSVIGVVLLFLSISTYFSVKQTGEIILEQLDIYGTSLSRSLANFCIEDLLAWDYPSIHSSIVHIGEQDSQIIEIKVYHEDKVVAEYLSADYPKGVAKEPDQLIDGAIGYCDCLTYITPVTYYVHATDRTRELGHVQIVLSREKYEVFLEKQINLLLILALVLMIGDTLLSYWTVKLLVLNPIKRIETGVKIISKGDLNYQIDVKQADEIGALATAFNKMTHSLELSEDEADDYKKHLEEKIEARTGELKELTESLEDKVEARTGELRKEKDKTRATLVSLTDGLIVFDKEKKIALINPAAEIILGLKENQVINKSIDKIPGFPNLDRLYKVLGRKIAWTDKKYELVLEKPLKGFFQVSIARVTVEKEVVGLMVVLHDITRDKEIDRMKNEFISIAAHQLRTPLSAIKWTLKMLLHGDMGRINKEASNYIKRINESNDRMVALINDLLNVSRIEEGRFVYEKKPVAISVMVKKIVSSLAAITAKKKIKISLSLPKRPLPKLLVDAEKVEQAIQNIIDNAIRYSAGGSEVAIRVKQIKEGKAKFIQIEVEDHGIGIADKDQEHLFGKFFRGENAVRTQTEGSGLGLFIVKNVVEAHNGKIWFDSKVNEGTTFYIKLPI